MVFKLVHEVGNRSRWRTDGTMSLASAKLLADELEQTPGVTGLRVNPRTGSVVVTVADWDARERVARYFASLEKAPLITRVDTAAARRALAQAATAKTESAASGDSAASSALSETIATVNRALSDMPVLHVWQRLSKHFLGGVSGRGRTAVTGRAGSGALAASAEKPEQEDGALDFAPLTRFLFLRPLLPVGLNAANALLASVPFVLSGVKSLLRGRFDVAVLDGAALLVSFLRRDFRTAGLLIVLLGLGEMLESYTRKKSMASLADELALRVDSVWVRRGDGNVKIALRDVTKEDVVVVHAGNAIPVDGIVVEGDGSVNQASMTGEPLPVHRMKGGTVFAGTVLEDGELMIRPTGVGDGTRLQQIVRFIENSEAAKAGIEGKALKWADRIVPYHFLLAGLVWLVTRDFARMASVLMVDFSCALRLATPLAILTAMRTGTQRGVVVKGGKYLEALAEVDTVVFDKTGTLTASAPKLSDVVSLDDRHDSDDLLRLAACLEEHFPHPVGRAVVHAAEAKGLAHTIEAHDAKIDYVVAHGIASSVEGERVVLGSRHFVEEDEGISVEIGHEAAERLAREGKSILYLAVGGRLAGLLGIEDPIREEAKSVIAALHERGVKEVWMLTGDDERTARVVAEKLGIDHYRQGGGRGGFEGKGGEGPHGRGRCQRQSGAFRFRRGGDPSRRRGHRAGSGRRRAHRKHVDGPSRRDGPRQGRHGAHPSELCRVRRAERPLPCGRSHRDPHARRRSAPSQRHDDRRVPQRHAQSRCQGDQRQRSSLRHRGEPSPCDLARHRHARACGRRGLDADGRSGWPGRSRARTSSDARLTPTICRYRTT